jgi:hypothetical protein
MALLVSCASGGAAPPPAAPPPATAWDSTLAVVKQRVARGEYAAADSSLVAFAATRPETPESREAVFWRALVMLDPANPDATPRDALLAIDAYLAGGATQPHFQEALLLRRTASRLERARTPVVTATITPPPVADDTARARAMADSLKALRLELERTQAELERIRRRIRP